MYSKKKSFLTISEELINVYIVVALIVYLLFGYFNENRTKKTIEVYDCEYKCLKMRENNFQYFHNNEVIINSKEDSINEKGFIKKGKDLINFENCSKII